VDTQAVFDRARQDTNPIVWVNEIFAVIERDVGNGSDRDRKNEYRADPASPLKATTDGRRHDSSFISQFSPAAATIYT
jgi:hypothetical protein